MREKSGKKGHRREISKQLIKRRLMEDLYPIPRQKQSTSRMKMKSALNIKFMNTLQFLEYNQVEVLMLHKFQQKLAHQLVIPSIMLDSALDYLKIDSNIYQLIKKLVNMHHKSDQTNDEHLMYLLKNLISTAREELKGIATLLFFYHFVCVNIEQYRTIMKEFQKGKIFQLACSLTYPKSQLITSKILSAVFMIMIKYNETQSVFRVGAKVIKLRRMIEKLYPQREDLRVNHEHARVTLFFSVKYIEALIKHNYNPYELMSLVQDELMIVSEQKSGLITNQILQLFKEEMLKLKNMVQSKIDDDYYHNYHSQQKVIQDHQIKDKVQMAIKKFKRRKSLNNITSKQLENKVTEISIFQCDQPLKNNQNEPSTKNFKDVYNPPPKAVQNFSKLSSQSNLKKGRKLIKASFFQGTSSNDCVSQKIDLKTVEQLSKQNVQCNFKSKSREKQVNPTLFMKLSSLYQLTNNYSSKKDEKVIQKQKLDKKTKIEKVYKNFFNLNKIVREIPRKQLERQFQNFQKLKIGTKSQIKQMLYTQIINFSAGLQNGNYEISSILNNKGCLQLQFIKIWLQQTYLITITIEVQSQVFILKVTLNGKKFNIILNRGSNVLCQRYVTIWPTIRYLVNKKLYQYSIFKRYESLLLIRKMPEASLIQLQSEIYLEKFGFISKEEIEEINICLDSVFKIILISRQYSGSYLHGQLIKINDEITFPYLLNFDKEDAATMKLNLLTEIYLSSTQKIVLTTFIYANLDKHFLIQVVTIKQKMINIIKNKQQLGIIFVITNLETFRTKIQNQIVIQWHDLQRSLIVFDDFKKYVIEICTHQVKNKHFAKRLVNYFKKRIFIKYHPIFAWECIFTQEAKPRELFAKMNERQSLSTIQFDKHFRRHRIQTVQSYCDNQAQGLKQAAIAIKSYDSRHERKDDDTNTIESSRVVPNILMRKRSKRKKNIGFERKQIWKQQKRIDGKQYLMILTVIEESINDQWIAQLAVINLRSQVKHRITLNHMDLFRIYEMSQFKKKNVEKDIFQFQIKAMIRAQKNIMLIQIINSTSFYYNYHISKICFQKDGNLFRHNFRQQLKLDQQMAKRRQCRNIITLNRHPLLEQFNQYCRLRIVKPIKVGGKFGFLTLKHNFIHQQSFWEIILQFPRRNTHYVHHLKEENMIFYISAHRKKKWLDSSFIPSFTHFQDSLNVSMTQQSQEDVINFKTKLLQLISNKQIKVIQRSHKYLLVIFEQQFQLRERIIQQYDPSTASIYNVWVNSEAIQVDILYESLGETDDSNASVVSSSFLNYFKKEIIGHIELSSAFRFYQMEDKDTNEEDFYLKRVCQFYFQFAKQKKIKYDKQYQRRIGQMRSRQELK